jgi:hypothetical protein
LIEKEYGLRLLHTMPGRFVVEFPDPVGVPFPTVLIQVKFADPLVM